MTAINTFDEFARDFFLVTDNFTDILHSIKKEASVEMVITTESDTINSDIPNKIHSHNHEETQKNSLSQTFPILYERLTMSPHHILTTPPSFKEINLKHQCHICGKIFPGNSKLNYHIKAHYGEKTFQCWNCNKCFITKNSLKSHIITHSTERPFRCEICESTFKTKNHLKTHYKYHIGERKYCCKICYKTFITNSNLKSHMQTHLHDKTYTCDICNKIFFRSHSVKRHKKSHISKTFSC